MKGGRKTRQTEEEVGRQHEKMDRPGVHQVPESSGEQGKMEKTGCKIICGTPTTLTLKGLMMMMGYRSTTHLLLPPGEGNISRELENSYASWFGLLEHMGMLKKPRLLVILTNKVLTWGIPWEQTWSYWSLGYSASPHHWPSLVLGQGIFNERNDLNMHCACEGERGIDKRAQATTWGRTTTATKVPNSASIKG